MLKSPITSVGTVLRKVCEEVVEAVSVLRDLMVDVDHSEEEVISILNIQHNGHRCGQGVCHDVVHKA